MATQIKATQISTSTTSWYQRLRTLQGKTPAVPHQSTKIIKTTDAGISAGNKITAANMNTFINALNGLQSNLILQYANWPSYAPVTVTAGKKISLSDTYTQINNMLTSLEALNANYSTNSVYADNDNAIYSNNVNDGNECGHNSTDTTYGHNGTNTVNTINGEDCIICVTDNVCVTYNQNGAYDAWNYCGDDTIDLVWDHESYGTNAFDANLVGDGVCYDWYECWTEVVTSGCWADCCVGHDGDCNTQTWSTCAENTTDGDTSGAYWSVEPNCPDCGDNTNDDVRYCAETTYGNNSDYDDCSIDGESNKYGVYNCDKDGICDYNSTNSNYSNYSVDGDNTNCNTYSNYGEFNVTP